MLADPLEVKQDQRQRSLKNLSEVDDSVDGARERQHMEFTARRQRGVGAAPARPLTVKRHTTK
jgi:hypothetical protein